MTEGAYVTKLPTSISGAPRTGLAEPGIILGLILRESVVLYGLGIIVGIPCAIAATRLIGHMLFGVAPGDPLTFAAAASILLAVGTVAGYWPARHATKIDPIAALRRE